MPIYWVAATVARLILAKMWLMVHHPRAHSVSDGGSPLPQGIRDRVFITSVEVIEFSHLLEKNENTAKWGWLFRTYMQWQSVAFALSEICTRPPGPDVERAWRAIESVYDGKMMHSKYQKGMLWKPLRHLMAKAKARRAAQQANGVQVTQSADILFADAPNPTPMERFMQDYPANAGTNAMDAFGMGGQQPYEGGMAMDPQAQESMGATSGGNAAMADDPNNISLDGSSNAGLNWASEQVPFGNNDILNLGWSPARGRLYGSRGFVPAIHAEHSGGVVLIMRMYVSWEVCMYYYARSGRVMESPLHILLVQLIQRSVFYREDERMNNGEGKARFTEVSRLGQDLFRGTPALDVAVALEGVSANRPNSSMAIG